MRGCGRKDRGWAWVYYDRKKKYENVEKYILEYEGEETRPEEEKQKHIKGNKKKKEKK